MSHATPIFSVDDVLRITNGSLVSGTTGTTFYGISTDSRLVEQGNLFVALKGNRFDGHDFAIAALQTGAEGLLVEDERKVEKILQSNASRVVIQVRDTLFSLGELAHAWRQKFTGPVIGITGSSGKTTTKEMVSAILAAKRNVLKTEGNLNNLIGLPQTIFRLTDVHDVVVLEMGSNIRGEIKRLTQVAEPTVGLITNVGPAHLKGFGSLEAVKEEKGDLFLYMRSTGTAVVNLDDPAVVEKVEHWPGAKVTFSMSPHADVTVKDIEKNGAKGMSFSLIIRGTPQKVEMRMVGVHHVYNAMAAAALALAVGVDGKTIAEELSGFRPLKGRMDIVRLHNGAYLLDDSYNANPISVREALMTLKDLKTTHNAYVFLGDMLELGDQALEMHRRIGMMIATIGATAVFLQGDFSPTIAAGALEGGMSPEKIFYLSDQEDGMSYLKEHLKKGDWILVKGSRGMKMEKFVSQIESCFGVNGSSGTHKTSNENGVRN